MATKIRLQRHGRKGYAFYKIVVADSRAPRDGKFIERIGSYNPNTNPATIDLNFERALYWLGVGAQPTDTARNILSDEGVLMMKHLNGGVKKGAFNEEEAMKRFDAWKKEKLNKTETVKNKLAEAGKIAEKKRLEEEQKINEQKAQEVAKKRAEATAADVAESEEETTEEVAPAVEDAAPAAEEETAPVVEDAAPDTEDAAPAAAEEETATPSEE